MAPLIHNNGTMLMSVIHPTTYFIAKESGGLEVRHWTVIQVVLCLIRIYIFVKIFHHTD